jgi:hypothetical protein
MHETNLLEAIFVVAALRSFRTARLADLVAFGAERAKLGARVLKDDLVRVYEVDVAPGAPGRSAAPFLPVHLRSHRIEVQLFTMMTSIGTPLDVTAEEIHIERTPRRRRERSGAAPARSRVDHFTPPIPRSAGPEPRPS